MIPNINLARDKMLIYGIFLSTLVVVAIFLITGQAWVIVPVEQMAVSVVFLSVCLAILGGAIATYSFVSYRQTQELRFLVLGLLGYDMVFIAFAFLFTHPSSLLWIPAFADRQRNRSLAAVIGLSLVPSVLSGAFRGDAPKIEKQWIYSIWGIIIVPALVFWFTLSPEPVINTTITSGDGAIFNATIEGIILLLFVAISFLLSFIRYVMEWRKKGNRIILASSLSLFLWILSLILLGILDDPYTILELLWYSLIGVGFLLIAVAMITTSILEPHKVLYEIVDDRTRKLEQSEKEIVFYLDMWTHKIGNILQGMMTYLELLPGNSEDNNMVQNELAKDLGREGNLVNRQVIALTKIKQTKGKPLGSVNLRDAFIVASEDILSYYSVKGTPTLDNQVNSDIIVEADALLDHLFLSLFIHVAKTQDVENLQIIVNSKSLKDSVTTEIVCSEPVLSTHAQKYMAEVGISTQTQLGLELFIMKILLDRYHCKMEYSEDPETKESKLLFHFNK